MTVKRELHVKRSDLIVYLNHQFKTKKALEFINLLPKTDRVKVPDFLTFHSDRNTNTFKHLSTIGDHIQFINAYYQGKTGKELRINAYSIVCA